MKDDHLGWISLYRKIQNNFLWKDGRVFSKLEAWLDILMEVQHSSKQTKTMIKNTLITCDRGQSIKSIQTWAERWNWSRSAVQRYFQLLKREGMVRTENLTKTIRLSVCKYTTYQNTQTEGELKVNRTWIEPELNPDTDNKGNNDNNGNNVNTLHKKPEGIDSFFTTEKYTLQQFTDKAVIAGLSDDEATEAYHHFRAQGFNRGNGQPLLSIESGLVIWARNRHKFALKTEPDEDQRKKKVRERSERILKNARHTG